MPNLAPGKATHAWQEWKYEQVQEHRDILLELGAVKAAYHDLHQKCFSDTAQQPSDEFRSPTLDLDVLSMATSDPTGSQKAADPKTLAASRLTTRSSIEDLGVRSRTSGDQSDLDEFAAPSAKPVVITGEPLRGQTDLIPPVPTHTQPDEASLSTVNSSDSDPSQRRLALSIERTSPNNRKIEPWPPAPQDTYPRVSSSFSSPTSQQIRRTKKKQGSLDFGDDRSPALFQSSSDRLRASPIQISSSSDHPEMTEKDKVLHLERERRLVLKQLDVANTKFSALQVANENLQDELEAEKYSLIELRKQCNQEVQHLQFTANDLYDANYKLKVQLDEANEHVANLKEENANVNRDCQGQDRELKQMTHRMQQLEAQLLQDHPEWEGRIRI